MSEVIILNTNRSLTQDEFSSLLPTVSSKKRDRVKRFRFFNDASNTLLGDVLARLEICHVTGLSNVYLQFSTHVYGKPFLLNNPEVHYNISHSGNYIACVIDNNPVGIDIEVIKHIDLKIAERFFTHDELEYVLVGSNTLINQRFFEIWTKKESRIKTEESVVVDNILTQFHGIVSQDHEAKFYNFGGSNATCCAHLTRELRGLSDLYMLTWAAEVRHFFLEMNDHKNADVHNGIDACEPTLLCTFESRYNNLLQDGRCQLTAMPPKSFGYDELRRMVNRLDKHKDNYLLFIRNYEAPFTNNQAERDLRHCKTRQKVSGCFRSWQGVLTYCKIRSVLDILRPQNIFKKILKNGVDNVK